MKIRGTSLLLWLFGATHALCQTTSIPSPDVRVGDRWTYAVIDFFTKEPKGAYRIELTHVTGKAIVGLIEKGDGEPLTAAWTSAWNATTSETGRVYTPHQELLRFPLFPGLRFAAQWEIEARTASNSIGEPRVRHERDIVVRGWEDVEVAAGKFRALKIEANGSYHRLDNPSIYGPAREVIWYSPAVNRWVKRTYENFVQGSRYWWEAEELVRYEPAAR